VVEDSVKGLI
jgi:hypothetical protein